MEGTEHGILALNIYPPFQSMKAKEKLSKWVIQFWT